jgi:hypothetical protein
MTDLLNEIIRTTFTEFAAGARAFAPKLLAMLVILVGGAFLAGAVRMSLSFILPRLGINRLADHIGLGDIAKRGGMKRSPSNVIALATAWIVLAMVVLLAIAALDIQVARDLVAQAFAWLPQLLVAMALLLVGALIAAFVRRSVLIAAVNAGLPAARLLASGAHTALLALFAAMALEHIGLGRQIILVAFTIVFGGIVLALALAYGLAGRELARDSLERLLRRREGPGAEDGLKHL